VLSWAAIRIGCVSKTLGVSLWGPQQNGWGQWVHSSAAFFWTCSYSCIKPVMAEKIWEDQQSSDLELSRMSACKMCLAVVLLHWVRELWRRIVAQNQLNCRCSRPHSRITHIEGVVSLTPRILSNTISSHFWTGLSVVSLQRHSAWDGCSTFENEVKPQNKPNESCNCNKIDVSNNNSGRTRKTWPSLWHPLRP